MIVGLQIQFLYYEIYVYYSYVDIHVSVGEETI